MIKIEDYSKNGKQCFELEFKDPKIGWDAVWAKNLAEVHEAINHYYQQGPRIDAHAKGEIAHCPLCRLLAGRIRVVKKFLPKRREVS